MASSLSNLVNNLSEGVDDKKCEICGIKYKYCDCLFEYINCKNDFIFLLQKGVYPHE